MIRFRDLISEAYRAIVLLIDAVLSLVALVLLGFYRALRQSHAPSAVKEAGCRLLVLQPNILAALQQHGERIILENHHSPYPERMTLLDPSGREDSDFIIGTDTRVISWSQSGFERFLRGKGFQSSSEIFGALVTAERLIRFLERTGDNVVRTAMHDRTALFALIACRAMRIPYIVEVAGNYELLQRQLDFTYYFGNFFRLKWFRRPAKAFSNWMLSLPIRAATRVIGRNKNNYEHAFALGADIERLSLIRIRISPGFFNRADAAGAERDVSFRYILYVARLAPEKRPVDCIEIFEKVAGEVNDVHLVIIGDGPLMPDVEGRIKTSAYAERVHVLGARSNTEVLKWTRGAAVGLELYSGSSLVEKMSCAVPIVSYDVEWMSEVVIDGYTGYTADFMDTAGMAACCVKLLNDPSLAGEMGKRARLLAEVLFNRDAIIEKEDRYLRRLAY